jgi:hypothetical protein
VNKNTRNIINWVLIAMLAMLPLRSVMAVVESTCELHDEVSQGAIDHDMHMVHMRLDDASIDTAESSDCCCCESSMKCTSDCGIGTSASFIAQSAVLIPALNETVFQTHVKNDLVFRDLAPPIRPPASL